MAGLSKSGVSMARDVLLETTLPDGKWNVRILGPDDCQSDLFAEFSRGDERHGVRFAYVDDAQTIEFRPGLPGGVSRREGPVCPRGRAATPNATRADASVSARMRDSLRIVRLSPPRSRPERFRSPECFSRESFLFSVRCCVSYFVPRFGAAPRVRFTSSIPRERIHENQHRRQQ